MSYIIIDYKDYKLSEDKKTLRVVAENISGHFDVPDGVEVIGDRAF